MLNPKQVAAELRIGYTSAQEMMATGAIAATNIARPGKRAQWRSTPEAVEAYKRNPVSPSDRQADAISNRPAPIYRLEEGPLESWSEQKRRSHAA